MAKKQSDKIPNTIVDNGLLSNSRSWVDYMDKDSLAMFPGKDEWRQRLIKTMYAWSEKPDSLEILQFCMEYKIPYGTLKEWDRIYPDIAEAYQAVKLNVACHRRVGTMNRKLDGTYAYKDMHWYQPEWHSINQYHSDLKKEEEKQPHVFIVNAEKPKIVSKEDMLSDRETEL